MQLGETSFLKSAGQAFQKKKRPPRQVHLHRRTARKGTCDDSVLISAQFFARFQTIFGFRRSVSNGAEREPLLRRLCLCIPARAAGGVTLPCCILWVDLLFFWVARSHTTFLKPPSRGRQSAALPDWTQLERRGYGSSPPGTPDGILPRMLERAQASQGETLKVIVLWVNVDRV